MRRVRSRVEDDLDTVDVLLDEDEAVDEGYELLHQIALEALAARAVAPGSPWGDPERIGPTGPREEDRSRARRLRRSLTRHPVLWAAVVTTVVTVAVVPAVLDARETAARLDRLASDPGVLEPAAGAPVEAWRLTGRVVTQHEALLLVVDDGALRRIDPTTGDATWEATSEASRAAATGTCFPLDEGLLPGRLPVTDGPAGLVACVAGPDDDAAGPAPDVRVVVVDTATGVTRLSVTSDGRLLLAEPVGRDLLLATASSDGRVHAVRWDVSTRSARWSHRSGEAVNAADAVERRAESLTLGSLTLDLATGAVLDGERARRQPIRWEEYPLPGGGTAMWAWYPERDGGRGRAARPDLGRSFGLPGPPLVPHVGGGSHARTLVVRTEDGDRIRGLNARTGEVRWSQPWRGGGSVRADLQVDGVLILDDGAWLTALDVTTGAASWTAAVDPHVAPGRAVTDGAVVVHPVRGIDGRTYLVARALADGAPVWDVAVPGTRGLAVVDRRLVTWTDDAVVGLAFPADG